MYTIRKYAKKNTVFEGEPPKKVLVQVGKSFFTLTHSFDIERTEELKELLENISISIKLLKEGD